MTLKFMQDIQDNLEDLPQNELKQCISFYERKEKTFYMFVRPQGNKHKNCIENYRM